MSSAHLSSRLSRLLRKTTARPADTSAPASSHTPYSCQRKGLNRCKIRPLARTRQCYDVLFVCYLVLVAVAHDDAAPEAERELLEQQRLHGAVVLFVEAAVAVVCAGDGLEWR